MEDKNIDTSNMTDEEIMELQKKNCIFCNIAKKNIPAKIIHEDEEVICILDINPASEGHILVYPKEHYMILPHIPDKVLEKLFYTVRLMSKTLLKTFQVGGTSVLIANGLAAGQKAPHVLIHVIPRRNNDGLLNIPNYDMNEEQKNKLKELLAKQFIKHFGHAREIEKNNDSITPNFLNEPNPKLEEQSLTKKEKKDYKNEEKVEEKERIIRKEEINLKGTKNKRSEEKRQYKKRHKKQHEEQKKEEQKKAINLDDIAKLFGG